MLARATASSNHLAPEATRHHAFNWNHHFSTKHDIEDESDIIELGKEEEQELLRGPNDEEFAEKIKSHRSYRHDDMGHDIEDESDLVELGKEEAQDMAKGISTEKKIHHFKKHFDVEDESDVIECEKEVKGEDRDARKRKQRLSAATEEADDGINYDIEDESDIIEVAKEELEEMEKKIG